MVVVIPAHDEAGVLGNLLTDLADQDRSAEVWVLADRCTDDTASIARQRGVEVAERHDGPPGKGAALTWFLSHHPLGPGDVLVVVDADNRVPPDLVSRIVEAVDVGAGAVQGYLDTANPDAGPLATAAALQYWAANRMVQYARQVLRWQPDLGGTGMAITGAALGAAGGFGGSATEDQDLTVRLWLAGERVTWLHDVRIRDEKPASVGVAVRQRARWAGGRRSVARTHVRTLLRVAWRRRDWAGVDLAWRLIQPGRTLLALVSVVLAVVAWLAPGWLWPWPVWAGIAVVQFVAPIPFLVAERVPAKYLWRYPLLAVFGILWLPIRVVARRATGWYHTPHQG